MSTNFDDSILNVLNNFISTRLTVKSRDESPTPKIFVYLVSCSWPLNCTTGVFRSLYCLQKCATSAVKLFLNRRMHRNQAPQLVLRGRLPGKEKEGMEKKVGYGGKTEDPNFLKGGRALGTNILVQRYPARHCVIFVR